MRSIASMYSATFGYLEFFDLKCQYVACGAAEGHDGGGRNQKLARQKEGTRQGL